MEVPIAIDSAIEWTRPECKRVDNLSRVQSLGRAVDATRPVKLQNTVGEHFGVHAQMANAALQQERTYRIGHPANTNLQARAVFNLGGNSSRDLPIDVGGWRIRQLCRRLMIAFDDVVDLAQMYAVVLAVHIREALIHLDDHHPGALDHGAMPDIGRPKVEMIVLVLRAGLEDDHVHRSHESAVVVGHLAKVERYVVAAAGVVFAPVVAREVPAEKMEMLAARISLERGPRDHGQTGTYLDVLQLASSCGERCVETIRLTQRNPVIQPHPRGHESRSAFTGDGSRRCSGNSHGHEDLPRSCSGPKRRLRRARSGC